MNNPFPRQSNNRGAAGGGPGRGSPSGGHNSPSRGGSSIPRGASNPVVSRKFDKPGGTNIPSPPPVPALRKSDNVIHTPSSHGSPLSKSANSIASRGGRGQPVAGNVPQRSQSPSVNRGSPVASVNRGSPVVNRGSPALARGGSPSMRGGKTCTKCNTLRQPSMKFCGECGAKFLD